MSMPSILVAIAQEADRRLLSDWLSRQWQVLQPEADRLPDAPVDLAIVDGLSLGRYHDQLHARQEAEKPSYLPVLLVLPRQNLKRLTPDLWRTVDEVLLTPIEQVELEARIQVLLRIRRYSQQLREQNAALLEADRLKTEFFSVVNHELRTPINAIVGFASILEDELAGPLNEDQSRYVGQILSSSERVLSLINNLLDMSRMAAGRFEVQPFETDYPPIVEDVVTMLRPLADEKHIELRSEVAVPDMIWMDGDRIAQVITNLISNAVKFTPEGGRIQVRAFVTGDTVTTQVTDSGVGIAPEDLPKLFQRFSQLKATAKAAVGSGLGLSICKGIVEAHRGRMGVTSEPGKGSTFWFTLPLRQVECMGSPPSIERPDGAA